MILTRILILLILVGHGIEGQNVMWTKSYWPKDNPFTSVVENFPRSLSGEDWSMKHIPSKDAAGKIEGFVVVGFNDFMNYMPTNTNSCPWVPGWRRWTLDGLPGSALPSPSCAGWETGTDSTSSSTRRKGVAWASISKYKEDGTELWQKVYGYAGSFENIIQTSDGGYLAVGVAEGTRDFMNDISIAYNPKANVANTYFVPGNLSGDELTVCKTGKFEKWLATKIDRDGNVVWSNIYGVPQYSGTGFEALVPKGWAYAVVEMDNGKFLIGGTQQDPDYAYNERPAIIQLDANGKFEWGEYYLTGATKGGSVQDFQRAVVGGSSVYLAAGMEGYADATSPYNYRIKTYIAKVDVGGSHTDDEGIFSWIQNHGYEPTVKQNMRVTDIALNTAGQVLFPVIRRTGSYCFNWNCTGDATMYILNPSDGSLFSSIDLTDYSNSADNLKAYDLRLGVMATFDGRFAIVSTVQPNGELVFGTDVPNTVCGGDLSPEIKYFETDAYVAKYSNSGKKVWSKSFDSGTATPSGPRYGWSYPHPDMLDLKRQECLYSIIETSTRSAFIVIGNNSDNFDDFYFARINSLNLAPIMSQLLE